MASAIPTTPKLILDDVSLRRLLVDLNIRFTFSIIRFSENFDKDMEYLLELMESNPRVFSSYLPSFNSENN